MQREILLDVVLLVVNRFLELLLILVVAVREEHLVHCLNHGISESLMVEVCLQKQLQNVVNVLFKKRSKQKRHVTLQLR